MRQIEAARDLNGARASVWKRSDGYHIVDSPEDRYNPNKIKGYRSDQNVMDSNADEHEMGKFQDGKVYCGPDNISGECDDLPKHRSERITELELKLVERSVNNIAFT